MCDSIAIYRAPWLVTLDRPIISDGAVAVCNERILDSGRYSLIKGLYPEATLRQFDESILMPPLINAHTHLELSYLQKLGMKQQVVPFIDWVENLLETRASYTLSETDIIQLAQKALQEQYGHGVIAFADTGNLENGWQIGNGFGGDYTFLHEHLGLAPDAAQKQLATIQKEDDSQHCIAHAAYSTAASLIQALKQRATENKQLFSIHVAETEAENEFIRHNSGPMREFLERRGAWHSSFIPTGIDKSGAVQYLHNLGVLDASSLCVHCVHVHDSEVEMLASSGAHICMCPGSNRYLDVGKAPLDKFLNASLLPALGTDSLASNPILSIWNEMQIVAQDFPHISPETILKMATKGGAQALGIDHDFGVLAKGKSAKILLVHAPEANTAQQVMELLVNNGTAMNSRLL